MPSTRLRRAVPGEGRAGGRLRRAAWEALGVVVASSFALVALAHALAGAKRSLLLWDGDSVLLPLLVRSLERGEAFEWGMSPVLFAFPELPLYLASAAVTTSVAAALLLNGVLNVVLLYAVLRFVASRVAPSRGRAIGAALVGVAALTVACLLESRPGGNTGEVASLFLTTTYYSGSLLALVAAIGLVMTVVGRRGRRNSGPLVALGALAALATWSNPLFVLWATAPIGLALVVLALLRRPVWRRAGLAAGVLLVGSGVGYVGRLPLGPWLIAQQGEYFRWDGQGAALAFLGTTLLDLARTPGGALELAGIAALLAGTIGLTVRALVRREPAARLVPWLIAGATLVVVPGALLAIGNVSTRYALPLLFVPLTLLVVGVASRRAPEPSALARRAVAVGTAAVVVIAVGVGGAAGARVVATGAQPDVPGAACLARWSAGVDVAGAGQFWSVRGLQAYAPSAELIQVNGDLTVYPWLTNLAPAERARVGYLIVATGLDEGGHADYWGGTVAALGTPRATVACGRFTIYDYRGTPAEARLTSVIRNSARAQAALRGFGADS